MKRSNKLIADLSILGRVVGFLSGRESEFPKEYNKNEIEELENLIDRVHIFNAWFTSASIKKSLEGIALFLKEDNLNEWIAEYAIDENKKPKTIAVIMASNIPMVGFHDLLTVLMSGNNALIKLSKDDDKLLPALLNLLFLLDAEYKKNVRISDGNIKDFDAVIATGSDNTSRYFDYYFKNYPSVIRKNRTSIAVIDEDTSDEELIALADDVFDFYGLGCRNVSKLFIPKDFDLDRFFKAMYAKNEIIHHNKYANNYDYNKAIHLMNQDDLLDNGFMLLKESDELFSPLAMLFYQRYSEKKEVEEFIEVNKDKIQAVVGKGHIVFGDAQKPGLKDYADGVDIMEFLINLD